MSFERQVVNYMNKYASVQLFIRLESLALVFEYILDLLNYQSLDVKDTHVLVQLL